MLLTFTNRAAREMRERAEAVVGESVSSIWSGTFHSICARFLRRYGTAIGYQPGFQILDEEDQKKLIGDIIKSSVADPKEFPKKEIVAKIVSEAANEQKPVAFVASRWLTKTAGVDPEAIAKIAEKYAVRKLAGSKIKWYGLETSSIIEETVPLVIGGNRGDQRIQRK
jgi:DNA helicase-2/ATP-dependent DNA helicase PcrA